MSRDDAGVIAIVVALFAVVLFGFAALVVDVGSAADVKAQAAAAADAGALAGSRDLATWVNANGPTPDPNLEDAVTKAVALNLQYQGQNWASCQDTIEPGFTPLDSTECIQYKFLTTGSTITGSRVRVRIPTRKVQATFGGLFGVSSIKVSPFAEALSGQAQSPPCGPCNPALDDVGNPESAPVPTPDLVQWLPDPADTTVTPIGAVDAHMCPTGPGLFSRDAFPTGLTLDHDCSLTQGVYVFDDTNLTVEAGFTLTADKVTLVFYGRGKLAVEGTLSLTASPAGPPPVHGVPGVQYPGVALVLAQYKSNPAPNRTFELGPGFQINGSVYALDNTTWHTDSGDCPANNPPACAVDPGDLAVTETEFLGGIPTVAPRPVLPPQPPHLVK